MSLRARPAAAALLSLLAAPAAIADPLALAPAFDQIYSVDLATGKATLVGPTGAYAGLPVLIKGLAFSPDGRLLGTSDNTKTLFQIDYRRATTAPVGSLGLAGQGDPDRFDAMDLSYAVTCDGSAWLASGVSRKLWRVDPNSGMTSLVGSTGVRLTGLAARGRELFGTGDYENPSLFKVDTVTGAVTTVGSFNLPAAAANKVSSVWPAFDPDGTLWAAVSYIPPPPPAANPFPPDWSDLARIDASSGFMSILGQITGPEDLRGVPLFGLAIAPPQACPRGTPDPQPVPAGSPPLNLLLAGLIALGAWFSQRRRTLR